MTGRAWFTTAMLLSAAIGGGWLVGVAARARTAVAVVPVAAPDDPDVTQAAGVRIDGPRVGSARTGDTNWEGGAVPVLRIFGDYECGACQALDVEAGDSLRALAAAGRLTLIYHHRPLRTHTRGSVAAAVAYCGAAAGRAGAVHVALQRSVQVWSSSDDPLEPMLAAAARAGAPADSVAECLSQNRMADRVAADRRLAAALNVVAVPTVFLDGSRLEFRSFAALLAHVADRAAKPGAPGAGPPT